MLAPAFSICEGSMNHKLLALTVALVASVLAASAPAPAETALSPEEARTIEFGKEIYKIKANCQYCHKWDASGDTGYGGIALSLRKSRLNPEQLAEVVKCGRPGTGMPYHDQYSYTDKRCYDLTKTDLGKDAPPMGEFLSKREVDAVIKYLFARVVGRGESTYDDCVDFW